MTEIKKIDSREYLITGPRLTLRKLKVGDVNEKYLGWMNDEKTQEYTRRRGQKMTMAELEKFIIDSENSKDWHFAIVTNGENKHIGNIFLALVDDLNKSADISIMIGDKDEWGKGYGSEAIKLLTEFAFKELKMHRLSAGSPNPSFNVLIKKNGWALEGTRREAFIFKGKFLDLSCWSILENEYLDMIKAGKDII